MFGWQKSVGVITGLIAGFVILSLTGSAGKRQTPSGPILSECDGRLRELVIHYEPSAKPIVAAAYRDFLRALEPDVIVHVVCPNADAYVELKSIVHPVRCQLSPILVRHPFTAWSRDRWIALTPVSAHEPTTLWLPRGEAAEEVWPARAGDERVGHDLATALETSVRARRSSLFFDGGDFLADGKNIFVVSRVLQRNIQHTVSSRSEFLNALNYELKRRIVLLDESPDHHAGMFMASVGNNVMLVGDPRLGRECVPGEFLVEGRGGTNEFMNLPGGPDFTPVTQHLFDAVAAQCSAVGYRVVRIPIVPGGDGRTYLTCLNAIMESSGQRRIVYLPFYQGADVLNNAARAVWVGLGYEVRLVNCTAVYPYFGSLHCLVNVLKRS